MVALQLPCIISITGIRQDHFKGCFWPIWCSFRNGLLVVFSSLSWNLAILSTEPHPVMQTFVLGCFVLFCFFKSENVLGLLFAPTLYFCIFFLYCKCQIWLIFSFLEQFYFELAAFLTSSLELYIMCTCKELPCVF